VTEAGGGRGRYGKVYGAEAAARYAREKEGARAAHRAECALAARALARVPREETLLDVPCGTARMSSALARLGFARLACADVSPAMLDLARERLRRESLRFPLVRADVEALPFAARSFDTVFCFRLFHHLPDDELRRTVAAELCRVSRRRVVVSYLDARAFTSRKRALELKLRPRPTSRFAQTPRAAAEFFTAQGLRLVADLARLPLWHSLRVLVLER